MLCLRELPRGEAMRIELARVRAWLNEGLNKRLGELKLVKAQSTQVVFIAKVIDGQQVARMNGKECKEEAALYV